MKVAYGRISFSQIASRMGTWSQIKWYLTASSQNWESRYNLKWICAKRQINFHYHISPPEAPNIHIIINIFKTH